MNKEIPQHIIDNISKEVGIRIQRIPTQLQKPINIEGYSVGNVRILDTDLETGKATIEIDVLHPMTMEIERE